MENYSELDTLTQIFTRGDFSLNLAYEDSEIMNIVELFFYRTCGECDLLHVPLFGTVMGVVEKSRMKKRMTARRRTNLGAKSDPPPNGGNL